MLPAMLNRTAVAALARSRPSTAVAAQHVMALSTSASAASARAAASSTHKNAAAMAAAGLVMGGAGLLWSLQPAPAQNAAAGAAAAGQAGSSNKGVAPVPPSAGASSHHLKPVYDIDIKSKTFPKEVPVFIEVAKNAREKYEWDSELGLLRLDRILHSAVAYPFAYGFVPQTLCGDGDPLDVLVMSDFSLEPGCIADCRVIGFMTMEDEKGADEKVLAVLTKDPRMAEVHTLRDVPEHILREISCFFEQYKTLEREKWVKVGGWKGTADTCELVEQSHQMYLEKKKKEAAAAAGGK